MDSSEVRRRIGTIVGSYALVATLWILFSDRALGVVFDDPDELVRYSTVKGIAFVTVTTVLLLVVIRRAFTQIVEANDVLRASEEAARQERRFSDTVIDSMPGVLYLYDTSGRFLRWNENFQVASGRSAAEVEEMAPLDFFPVEDRSLVEDRIAQVFEHGEASVEASLLHHDGSTTPYLWTGRRVPFAGRTCLVGVGIDISERVEAEHALQRLNDTLEHRVEERTDELRTALERAESADRLKSSFLATMSHELRTPLNSILGFTAILLQEIPGPVNEEQGRQLEVVRTSARHLLSLIDDVLDLSKIEAGQLEVRAEDFALGEVIERTCEAVRPMADEKGLTLEIAIPPDLPLLRADRRRTAQILLNLLTNAIKFTESGTVGVTVTSEHARLLPSLPVTDVVRVRVRDTGIGIARHDLPHLFQPFRQLDDGPSRRHEGTGLGLAICRRLAELMGGNVTATSELGLGSEFTLTLPREPQEGEAP